MRRSISALAIALFTCTASHAANLIVGGGFEAPSAPVAFYILDVTPDGWSGTGDIVGQGYAGAVTSGQGLQWFDLNPGTQAGTGISQTVALTAATPYTFSFIYNGGQSNPGFTTEIAFTLSTASDVLLASTVSTASMNVYNGTPWAFYSSGLTVAADTNLTVRFQPNGVWANGFIDAVSVSAVPEPGVGYLMLLGLAAIVIRRSL